jgi:hypothetical protein
VESSASRGAETASDAHADAAFVREAYAYVLGFSAQDAEVAACLRALAAWRAAANVQDSAAGQTARANLVWALLNHNDFVTLR